MDQTCTPYAPPPEPIDDEGIIPFADEVEACSVRDELLEEGGDAPAQDSARGVFGEAGSRISHIDRELGLDTQHEPQGGYVCPCCSQNARRVVRVRIVNRSGWAAVCAVCAASMLERLPGTVVGGMVRPRRKRKISRVHAPQPKGGAPMGGEQAGQTAHGFRPQQQYRRAG